MTRQIELQGTYTEENLKKAMQGEANAYILYQIYAKLIGNESKDLENKINLISHNEKEHFKIWAKLLLEDDYSNNDLNLVKAIRGEVEECQNLYPEFARVAREEGFEDIAEKFEQVSRIECSHSWDFKQIRNQINDYPANYEQKGFKCLNCGYIHNGENAPDVCPVCDHPKSYFKKMEE